MAKDPKERLLIKVAQIPEQGLEIEEEFPREWLTNIPEFSEEEGTHIEGVIRVFGKLIKDGDNLRLLGGVKANLATICTRCGDPIIYPLEGKLEMTLMRGPEPDLPQEMELTPEDMSRGYYDGVEVDLAPFFQEEIAIQVPIQTLCQQDCAGLCPACGKNLNLEKCGCQTRAADPRLEVLRGLKIENK